MFQYLPVNPSLVYGWKTHDPTFPSSFADSSMILNTHNTSTSFHLQPHSHHHHINNLDDIALVHAQNSHYHHQVSTVTDDPTASREEEDEEKKKPKKASDRHSKIAVKNRLRHRRTRLSIEVARQLFELQDMLGFERASKAVEWLLHRARPDITKLRRERDPGLVSEGEAVDSGLDVEPNEHNQKKSTNKNKKKEYRRSRSSSSSLSRSTYSATMAKAAREMARKRARDRTLFKRSRMTPASNNSWQSMGSSWVGGFHEQAQQVIPCADNLVALPDDLFHDIGMSFEMTTIPSMFCV